MNTVTVKGNNDDRIEISDFFFGHYHVLLSLSVCDGCTGISLNLDQTQDLINKLTFVLKDKRSQIPVSHEDYKYMYNQIVLNGRRAGNTTRAIDHAIQMLFEYGEVKIMDLWDDYSNYHANDNMFYRVLRRIEVEHGSLVGNLTVNKKESTLKIIDKSKVGPFYEN